MFRKLIQWLKHRHKPKITNARWVEINGPGSEGKQNKPAEFLREITSTCKCGDESRAYYTPEQMGCTPAEIEQLKRGGIK